MRRLLVLSTIMLLVLAVSASAQEGKKMNIYVGAGVGVPTGDAGDGWKMGFHGQAGLGFKAAPTLEIIPTIGYHTFGVDDEGSGISGGTLSILMFGGDVKFLLGKAGQKTSPFLLAGVGMGSANISDMTVPGFGTFTFEGETKVYFNFGGGIDIASSPSMAVTLMARYVSVATEGSAITYIPFTVGLKF